MNFTLFFTILLLLVLYQFYKIHWLYEQSSRWTAIISPFYSGLAIFYTGYIYHKYFYFCCGEEICPLFIDGVFSFLSTSLIVAVPI